MMTCRIYSVSSQVFNVVADTGLIAITSVTVIWLNIFIFRVFAYKFVMKNVQGLR